MNQELLAEYKRFYLAMQGVPSHYLAILFAEMTPEERLAIEAWAKQYKTGAPS